MVGDAEMCSCQQGYRLGTDSLTCQGIVSIIPSIIVNHVHTNVFLDIDECAESMPCDQVCQNRDGSFNCSCNDGYLLDTNGRTCNG